MSKTMKKEGGEKMTMLQIGEKAKQELGKVIGLPINTVLAIIKEEQNGWKVIIELIEQRCVPDSGDLLGIYEAMMDDNGQLLSFKRKKTRKRTDCSEEEW